MICAQPAGSVADVGEETKGQLAGPLLWWVGFLLKESFEETAGSFVEAEGVDDEKLNAVAVGDEEAAIAQATNVFLALEREFRWPSVGVYLPGARRREGVDGLDVADDGREVPHAQFIFDDLASRGRHCVKVIYPEALFTL